MKKLVVLALSALLVVAFTLPASALEAQFGGYFRTRWWTQQNWYGPTDPNDPKAPGNFDPEAIDLTNFDQRTRLYLTAVFHENLKFVNKFEIDAQWGRKGGRGGYGADGDFGADGVGVEVKNSYADFNLGPVNFKVGIQGIAMGSSFLLDHDFAGAVISYQGENIAIPFIYIKGYEGGSGINADSGIDADDLDVDVFALNPKFSFGSFGINPFAMYWYSDNVSAFAVDRGEIADLQGAEELNLWYAGLTLEIDKDPLWLWATGIYQGGDIDFKDNTSADLAEAWLAAGGFDVDFGGMFSIHGEGFYATGDDTDDDKWESFYVPGNAESYYWAEIMGFGMFDWYAPNNSPADAISNIMAGNLGFTVKPMDKLKITLDGWYAQKAEEIPLIDGTMGDKMGIEVDMVITYQLVEGLNLDLVGAYLFADEVITENDINGDDDPYLVGSRLSLSF